jgi:uncharacterized membrane protein (DUF106 family)
MLGIIMIGGFIYAAIFHGKDLLNAILSIGLALYFTFKYVYNADISTGDFILPYMLIWLGFYLLGYVVFHSFDRKKV